MKRAVIKEPNCIEYRESDCWILDVEWIYKFNLFVRTHMWLYYKISGCIPEQNISLIAQQLYAMTKETHSHREDSSEHVME